MALVEAPIGAQPPTLTNQLASMQGSGVDFHLQLQETQMSVNGYLSLVVHKEQKARKVEVKFKAWEWVMYAYSETINEGGNSRTERRVHTESAPIINNMEAILWADPSGILRPGSYQFPFSFPINHIGLQYCTMYVQPDGDHAARVQFTVEANIDVPWWADKSLKIEALIVPRPLVPPPHMLQPVFGTDGFGMTSCYCFCCCPSGMLEATCTINPSAAYGLNQGAVQGTLSIIAKNKSSIAVKQVFYFVEEELTLKLAWQRHGSHLPERRHYEGMVAIAGPQGSLQVPANGDLNITVPFQYPIGSLHPNGTFQKFNISHNLVVRFETEGNCAPNHDLRIPIFIAGSLASGGAPQGMPPPQQQAGYPQPGYPPQQGPPPPGYGPPPGAPGYYPPPQGMPQMPPPPGAYAPQGAGYPPLPNYQ